jgi:hypothetical protein
VSTVRPPPDLGLAHAGFLRSIGSVVGGMCM